MSSADPRLIIICGLPGVGKTTHARLLEARLRAIRLCPDEWMNALSINLYDERKRGEIEAMQWRFARKLLGLGLTVILEWGTWARSERDQLRLQAHDLGAAVELHYLFAPVDVLLQRIQHRRRENPPILRDALEHWCEIFQTPSPEEMALFDRTLSLDMSSSTSKSPHPNAEEM